MMGNSQEKKNKRKSLGYVANISQLALQILLIINILIGLRVYSCAKTSVRVFFGTAVL